MHFKTILLKFRGIRLRFWDQFEEANDLLLLNITFFEAYLYKVISLLFLFFPEGNHQNTELAQFPHR